MESNKQKQSKERNIQVFVRVRPLNSIERSAKSFAVLDCSSNKEITVKERVNEKITKTFGFDRVFNPDSKQVDVYKYVVNPLIDEVLAGYNCTVFAYGQTGTGKTFTMEGEKSSDPSISWQDDPLSGIVPRAMNHLFDELRVLGDAEYTVRVSFLEIYNEELIDLLSPTDDITKLRLFEDSTRKGSVIIQGLEEKSVHNKDEVYKILEKGSTKRQTAATLMNAHSSRSHTIFTITIHIKDNSLDGEELLKTGKLNLVDLAGSENIGRSGAQDKRAREAGNINQSLLTLGRCITALVEKTPHVPYRESKLTRLLQDSLGGRTKTSIIATVSPALLNLEETLSTLDYAHRAKNITNRPEINQKMSKKALLREYTEEIEKLRRDLQAAREKNGVFLAAENYDQMVNELEYMRTELTNKINNIKAVTEQKETLETVMEELKIKSAQEIEEKTQELNEAKETIIDSKYEKKEMDYVISKQKETEEILSEQAMQVKNVAEEATSDLSKVQTTLERVRKIDNLNATTVRELATKVAKSSSFFVGFSEELCTEVSNKMDALKLHSEDTHHKELLLGENIENQIKSLDNLVDNIVTCTGQSLARTQSENEGLIQEMLSNLKQKTEMHDQFCKKVLDKFNNMSEALIQTDLFQFEDNQHNLQEKLVECKAKLLSMQSDCVMFEEVLSENKLETVQEIERIECLLRDIHNEDKQLDVFHEKEDEILEQMSKLITTFKEQKTESRRKKVSVRNKMSGVTEKFNDLKVGVGARNNKLMSLLQEDTLKKTEKIIAHVHSISEETKEKNASAMDNVKDRVEDIVSHFNGVVDESKEIFDAQIMDTEQQCDKLIVSIKTHVDGLSQLTVEGIGTGVKGRTTVLRDSVQTHLSSYKRDMESLVMELTGSQEEVKNIQSALLEHHKCADIVKCFAESQYKKDVPSGETPPRKDFKYPNKFVATSPHERLISRFRLNVPRSKFLLELEESCTPLTDPSTSESELSTDNSDSFLGKKPRRSSSLNDLNSYYQKKSVSPANSDIVTKKTNRKVAQQKENKPLYKKNLSAGKIPIVKSTSGESLAVKPGTVSKSSSRENVLKVNNRVILGERN